MEAAHPESNSALTITKNSLFIESPLIKAHEMSINMLVKDASLGDSDCSS
jgi:hypothetical protein